MTLVLIKVYTELRYALSHRIATRILTSRKKLGISTKNNFRSFFPYSGEDAEDKNYSADFGPPTPGGKSRQSPEGDGPVGVDPRINCLSVRIQEEVNTSTEETNFIKRKRTPE